MAIRWEQFTDEAVQACVYRYKQGEMSQIEVYVSKFQFVFGSGYVFSSSSPRSGYETHLKGVTAASTTRNFPLAKMFVDEVLRAFKMQQTTYNLIEQHLNEARSSCFSRAQGEEQAEQTDAVLVTQEEPKIVAYFYSTRASGLASDASERGGRDDIFEIFVPLHGLVLGRSYVRVASQPRNTYVNHAGQKLLTKLFPIFLPISMITLINQTMQVQRQLNIHSIAVMDEIVQHGPFV